MAGVAPAGAHRRMVHRVGREARGSVGVAIAALNPGHGDVRRRGQASRRGTVVTARAIGVGGRVSKFAARPAGEACRRAGMARDAIRTIRRNVTGERSRPERALGTLAGVGAVMAGVAAAGAHRRVIHRVGREARGSVIMTVAALNPGHGDVRRRGQAGRRGAVVTARAIGVGGRVGEHAARPAGEARRGAGMAGDAIRTIRRNVTGERRRTERTLGALAGVGTVVAGVAAAGAHRRVIHRVAREARRRIGVAVAALNPAHGDVRRRGQAGRRGAIVTARAIGVGGCMGEHAARPAGEACGGAGMAGDAVLAVGGDVTREGCSPERTLGPLSGERAIVAGVAAARAHRRVIHCVAREARRGIGVAIAALNARHRDVRRRGKPGCRSAIVTARAIGVGGCVREHTPSPAGEAWWRRWHGR